MNIQKPLHRSHISGTKRSAKFMGKFVDGWHDYLSRWLKDYKLKRK